ncbi:MAG: hypothetical protein WAO91_08380 [Candidatus Nitrosotenuis sp.]
MRLARLSSFLLSKDLTVDLKLSEQPYIVLIPKNLAAKAGINSSGLEFDLVFENNRLSLIGRNQSPRETVATSSEEVAK